MTLVVNNAAGGTMSQSVILSLRLMANLFFPFNPISSNAAATANIRPRREIKENQAELPRARCQSLTL